MSQPVKEKEELKLPPIGVSAKDLTELDSSRGSQASRSENHSRRHGTNAKQDRNKETVEEARHREVRSVVFRSLSNPPFDVNPAQLLLDVSKRIKLPRCEGARSFKHLLKTPMSCQILGYFFWYLHCAQFQEESEKYQRRLLDALSEKFVMLFWSLKGGPQRDFFLEYYPFALASGVCTAFVERYPASRAEFTESFRNRVFQEARLMFSGVETTAEAMGVVRERMALDRNKGTGVGRGSEDMHVQANQDEEQGPSSSADAFTEDLREEISALPGFIDRKNMRPKRVIFDAMGTSPLIRHYIDAVADSTSNAHKALLLKRTTPTPGCAYGGVETFQQTPSRVPIQDQIHRKWEKSKLSHDQAIQEHAYKRAHPLDFSRQAAMINSGR